MTEIVRKTIVREDSIKAIFVGLEGTLVKHGVMNAVAGRLPEIAHEGNGKKNGFGAFKGLARVTSVGRSDRDEIERLPEYYTREGGLGEIGHIQGKVARFFKGKEHMVLGDWVRSMTLRGKQVYIFTELGYMFGSVAVDQFLSNNARLEYAGSYTFETGTQTRNLNELKAGAMTYARGSVTTGGRSFQHNLISNIDVVSGGRIVDVDIQLPNPEAILAEIKSKLDDRGIDISQAAVLSNNSRHIPILEAAGRAYASPEADPEVLKLPGIVTITRSSLRN